MDKKKKCLVVVVVLFLAWLCRPLPSEEKKIEDLFQLGFSPSISIDETTELPKGRMGEFLKEIEESRPFQFELAESQTTAFLLNEKEYIFSPETGLLLLPDDSIANLNQGMYALGAFTHEDSLYFARAKERKHLWLPGLFLEGELVVTRYEMEYFGFQPEKIRKTFPTEEEYMALLESVRK